MDNPYAVLELTSGASEADVRRHYLRLVRQFPPDRDPERFKQIREAYEFLRDPIRRWQSELFKVPEASLDQLYNDVRGTLRSKRIPRDVLFSLAEE